MALEEIVQNMVDANESEENIASVIEKYNEDMLQGTFVSESTGIVKGAYDIKDIIKSSYSSYKEAGVDYGNVSFGKSKRFHDAETVTIDGVMKDAKGTKTIYSYTPDHPNYGTAGKRSGTFDMMNIASDDEVEDFEQKLHLYNWDKRKVEVLNSALSEQDKINLEKDPETFFQRAENLALDAAKLNEPLIQKPGEGFDPAYFNIDEYTETNYKDVGPKLEEFVKRTQLEMQKRFDQDGKKYVNTIVKEQEAIYKPQIEALQDPIIEKYQNIFQPKIEKLQKQIESKYQKLFISEINAGKWKGYSEDELLDIYNKKVDKKLSKNKKLQALYSEYENSINSEIKGNEEINLLQSQFERDVNAGISLDSDIQLIIKANNLLVKETTEKFINELQPRFELIPKSIYDRIDNVFSDIGFTALPAHQKKYALHNAWDGLEAELKNQSKEKKKGEKGWLSPTDIAARKQEFFYRYFHHNLKDEKGRFSPFVVKDYANSILNTGINEKIDIAAAELQDFKRRRGKYEGKVIGYGSDEEKELTGILSDLKRIRTYAEDIISNPEKLDATWGENYWNGFTSGRAHDYIPFVSGIVELSDNFALKQIADKSISGETLSKEEELILELYAMRNISDKRVDDMGGGWNGYNAGKLTHKMMPYIGEFILTSGAFSAARAGTQKILKQALFKKTDDVVKRYISIAGKNAPTKLKFANKTIDAISWIAGTFAQTTVNPQHYVSETFKNMTPEIVLALSEEGDELIGALDGEGMGFGEAFKKGFGITWAEFGTERMGELIPGMGRWIRKDLMKNPDWMKRLLVGRYLAKKGWTKSEALNHFRKSKMGWHGFGGEMFEEIINQPLSNLIMGKDWNEGMDNNFYTELGQSIGITQLVFGGVSLAAMNRNGPTVMMINGERYETVDEFMAAFNKLKVTGAFIDANKEVNIRIDNDFVLADRIQKILELPENQEKQNNLETNEENLRDKIQANEVEIVAATTPDEQVKLDEIEEKLDVTNNKRDAITKDAQLNGNEAARSAALAQIEQEVNSLEHEKQAIISGITNRVESRKFAEEYIKTKEGVKKLIKEADADVNIIEGETAAEAAEQVYVNVEEQIFDAEKKLEEEGTKQRANYDAAYDAAIKEGKTEQEAEEAGAAAYDVNMVDDMWSNIQDLKESQLNIMEDMVNSHGAISPDGKTIIINKEFSLSTKGGNINVEAHEFLHFALRATLNNNPQTSLALGNALKAYLMEINPSLVRDASFRKRIQAYQNGTVTGEIVAAEEVLTIFSDALANKHIEFNEGVFDKIGNLIKRVLRGVGIRADFESGRDVFDFVREYNKTIKGAPVSERMKRIIKGGATVGGQLKADVAGYGKLMDKIKKGGYKFSKSESPILEAQANEDGKKVNRIYKNRKGNSNWKFDIANVYEGMLAKYLKRIENKGASLGRNSQERQENIDDFISNAKYGSHGIVDLIDTFNSKEMVDVKDPATGKMVQEPNTMSRWLNGTFPQRMSEFTENTTIDFEGWKVSEEDAGEIVSTEVGADVAVDIKAKVKAEKEKPNFRKSIVFEGKTGIDNNLIEKVFNSVVKAFGTKLPSVTTAEFRIALEKAFATELKTPIANAMGTRGVYDQFLIDNVGNFKFLPINTLVSIERLVKDVNNKIFARFIKRLTTQEEVREAVNAGLLVVKTEEQGPALYERLNPTEEQILAFYRGKNMKEVLGYKVAASTLGTRKDRLAEEFGIELASDATIEVLETNKDVAEKIEMLYNDRIENYAIEVSKRINRSSGYKFSAKAARKLNEANLSPADYAILLADDVNELQNEYPELYLVLEEEYEKENKPPDDFVDEGYIVQTKNLIPELSPFLNKKVDSENTYGGYQTKFKVKGEKRYAYDTKGLGEHFKHYTIPILDFIPQSIGVREFEMVEAKKGNYKILTHSIFKGDSNRGNAGHNLQTIKQRRGKFERKLTNMGSKTTERAAEAWAAFEEVAHHLELANSTFTGPNSLLRKIKEIQAENWPAKKKVKEAQKIFGKKAIDAAQKLFIAYNISVEDWVNEQVTKKKNPMTREKAMEYVIRDKQKNTNAVKGERAFAAFTSIYFTDGVQEVEHYKGEHVLDMATVSAETTNSIYRGTFDIDAMSILNGFEQSYVPSRFADEMDKLGGKNSPLRNRRFLLNPEIGKNVYDLATGKSMYELEFNKYVSEQTQFLVEAHTNSKNTSGFVNAYRNSLPIKPDKGISIWDFDDTLAKTKSGVRYTLPNISGKPQPGRKVIFLAGSAGSGKSNVVKQLDLRNQGFKIINSDISLEWLKKNHGLPADMSDFTSEQLSQLGKLQYESRQIALRKKTKFQGKGDGIVVDGTGASLNVMKRQVQEFKDKGYDVQMVFVETSLETALERNRARKERKLSDKIVTKNYEEVQNNKTAFQELFNNNFAEVKTDNLKINDPMPSILINKVDAFTKGYIKGRLNAGEYADKGAGLAAQGAKFDFVEFDIIVQGEKGPLFGKAIARAKKFGTKDQFILTARPIASAPHIKQFLDSQGLNIPMENIATLENSTSEAKALWVAEKIGEGYNNIYFADDALQNVLAVQNMVDQFDVKSDVQQARYKFSKDMNADFNEILEQTKGIPMEKRFSEAKAKQRGKKISNWQLWIPPSADDMAGLLMMFQGKGKQGMEHAKWFKRALLDPFARGYRDLNNERERVAREYKTLVKKFPKVKKKLTKEMPDGDFNYGDAIRVYLWVKSGFEVPGLSKTDKNNMVKLVSNNIELTTFADALGFISKGYTEPGEFWMQQNIVSDLEADGSLGEGRKVHLAEWIQNKNIIFSKENLAKIEAVYGSNFREALEDILYRMERGTNRTVGDNRIVNDFLNWMNGGISVVMNWNTRSAVLQTLSTVNFINWGDNNIAKAAIAFANVPQFAKDFAFIFNSDMLRQRRTGLKTTIESSEIAAAMQGSQNKVRSLIRYLLQIGFIPTKIADSFAIAMGGATFYRNRIKTYLKQGKTQEEAESQAWLDFQEIAEETQQSSRPDRISQQQASVLGRLILAFQNTPMQYMRLTKKEVLDLVNGRFEGVTGSNSFASKTGKIVYYAAIQNLIFYSMQTALFAMLFSDDDDDEEFFKTKKDRVANNMVDGVLRGLGIGGAVVSTIKNVMMKHLANKEKGYRADESSVLMEALKLSPPLSIKARQILSFDKTMRYNKDVIKEMETFDIDNPMWSASFNAVEAITNIPAARMYNKFLNVRESLNQQHEAWQRISMFFGWSRWDVGVEGREITEVKARIKIKKAKLKLQEKYPGKSDVEIKLIQKGESIYKLKKREQIRILKQLGLKDKDISKLRLEKNRVDKIMEIYKEDINKVESALEYNKNYKPTKQEQRSEDLFKMRKEDQINILMKHGLSSKKIKALKYEKDRVNKIIRLEKNKK